METPSGIEKIKSEVLGFFNPFTHRSPEKIIRLIVVVFTIGYLINFFNNLDLTVLMLHSKKWDFSSFEYFAPIILFPIGLYGFWMFKQYGWVIIVSLLIYSTISSLFFVALTSQRVPPEIQPFQNAINQVFQIKTTSYYLGQILLYGLVLFYINKISIKDKFKIGKRTQWLVISVVAIPLILLDLKIIF